MNGTSFVPHIRNQHIPQASSAPTACAAQSRRVWTEQLVYVYATSRTWRFSFFLSGLAALCLLAVFGSDWPVMGQMKTCRWALGM